MSVTKAINNFFDMQKIRNWDKGYFFFDIHSTILKSNYKLGKISDEFYPHAKEALQLMTKMPDIVMVIYTCSHPNEILEYIEFFKKHGITFKYVNDNPEVTTEGYGCYDYKPYMNVLFEDKAGFDGDTDWLGVLELMTAKARPSIFSDVCKSSDDLHVLTEKAYANYEYWHNHHPTIHSNRFDTLTFKGFSLQNIDFIKSWLTQKKY